MNVVVSPHNMTTFDRHVLRYEESYCSAGHTIVTGHAASLPSLNCLHEKAREFSQSGEMEGWRATLRRQ